MERCGLREVTRHREGLSRPVAVTNSRFLFPNLDPMLSLVISISHK
jgi:hypothetical protein